MELQQALAELAEGRDLSREQMAGVMHQVMSGGATDAQIGALLMGLRMKGETIAEIAGAAEAMRGLASPVAVRAADAVDLVGTGGDGANLFNVSTAACFVVAAAGGHVAKHGNRSVSSTSGSSDVLEYLGVPLDLTPEQVARSVDEVGLGFMFAPAHHSAMRHAIGPRRELGLRTLFNVLGPLTNPAGVKRQVLGVFSAALCEPLAEVLRELGSERALVVHSEDGLDEISIAGPTLVAELRDGAISSYRIRPEDFGRECRSLEGLAVASAASGDLIRAALGRGALTGAAGERVQKAAEIIVLNAGACIYVSGLVATLADGVALADDLISSGQALEKLREFVDFTRLMKQVGGAVATTILDRIMARKREEVAERRGRPGELEQPPGAAAGAGFRRGLRQRVSDGSRRSSPRSRSLAQQGRDPRDFLPAEIAAATRAEARLSLGTDGRRLLPGGGRLPAAGPGACALPVLRKDFTGSLPGGGGPRHRRRCHPADRGRAGDGQMRELAQAARRWARRAGGGPRPGGTGAGAGPCHPPGRHQQPRPAHLRDPPGDHPELLPHSRRPAGGDRERHSHGGRRRADALARGVRLPGRRGLHAGAGARGKTAGAVFPRRRLVLPGLRTSGFRTPRWSCRRRRSDPLPPAP